MKSPRKRLPENSDSRRQTYNIRPNPLSVAPEEAKVRTGVQPPGLAGDNREGQANMHSLSKYLFRDIVFEANQTVTAEQSMQWRAG